MCNEELCTLIIVTLFGIIADTGDFYLGRFKINPDDSLWEGCDERCPEVKSEFVDTGYPWIDSIINKDVLMDMEVSNEAEDDIQTQHEMDAFYNQPSIDQKQLRGRFAYLAKRIFDVNAQEVNPMTHRFIFRPEMIGQHKGLILMAVDGYIFTGGAHALSLYTYYVFDLKNKKQIMLDDVLIQGKKELLTQKLRVKFDDYLRLNKMDPTDWGFALTDNFTFSRDGMTFLYQPYEITPYSMDRPILQLSYQELLGIVQPQFLK